VINLACSTTTFEALPTTAVDSARNGCELIHTFRFGNIVDLV
jgi:hypothetical protein